MWDVVTAPLPGMSVQSGSQAVPPSALTRTWYLLMAVSEGSVQPSAMAASPPVAVRPPGAGGGSCLGVAVARADAPAVSPRNARSSMV